MYSKMKEENRKRTRDEVREESRSPHGGYSSCHSSNQDRKIGKRNDKGETVLHIASKRGDLKNVKALIREGAEVNQVDYAGWTPLHEAVNENRIEVAKYLLRNGANVNLPGFAGQTALHDAVVNGNEQIVRLLMKFRADPCIANDNGESPLRIAGEKEKIRNILLGNTSTTEGESSDARSLTSEASSDVPLSCQDYSSPGPDGGMRNSPRLTLKMSSSGNGKNSQGNSNLSCQISPCEGEEISNAYTESGEVSSATAQNASLGSSWNKDPYAFEDEDDEDRGSSTRGVSSNSGDTAAPNVGEANTNVKLRTNATSSQEEFHSQSENHEIQNMEVGETVKSKVAMEIHNTSHEQNVTQGADDCMQDCEKMVLKKVPPLKIRISQTHSKVESVSPQLPNSLTHHSNSCSIRSRETDSPQTLNTSIENPAFENLDSGGRHNSDIKESRSATDSPIEQMVMSSMISISREEPMNSNSSIRDCMKEELTKEEERTQRVGRTLRSHTAAQREREVKERMEVQHGGMPNVPVGLAESILAEEVSGRKSGASSPATILGSDCRSADVTPFKKRKLRARGGGGSSGSGSGSGGGVSGSGNVTSGGVNLTSGQSNFSSHSQNEDGIIMNSVSSMAVSTTHGGNGNVGASSGTGNTSGVTSGSGVSNSLNSSGGGSGGVGGTSGGGGGASGGNGGGGSSDGHSETISSGCSKERSVRIDLPSNPYHKAMKKQKELDCARERIVRITPKQPKGYQDYLLITKQYITQGKTNFAQLSKNSPPDDLGRQELKRLFEEQENERYNTALRFQSERERLILFAEEEVLRANNRAARAIGDQAKPYSFCSMIAYNDLNSVPQSKSTVISSKDDENVRDRFTYRTFVGWLQDSITEFEKLKKELLNRQMHEAEGLMMVQKMDWLKELKVDKAYDRSLEVKRLNDIASNHVPMVTVPSDFRVFQHDQL